MDLVCTLVGVDSSALASYLVCGVCVVWKEYLTTSDTQEYPLDLSILFSGGKETKRDSLSNGE